MVVRHLHLVCREGKLDNWFIILYYGQWKIEQKLNLVGEESLWNRFSRLYAISNCKKKTIRELGG